MKVGIAGAKQHVFNVAVQVYRDEAEIMDLFDAVDEYLDLLEELGVCEDDVSPEEDE